MERGQFRQDELAKRATISRRQKREEFLDDLLGALSCVVFIALAFVLAEVLR